MSGTQNAPLPVIPRTGIGIDVHAYAPEDAPQPLWLGGLFWDGERGLSGHSDGDPVAHAAADALFSACGVGDLGTHFGTDRPGIRRGLRRDPAGRGRPDRPRRGLRNRQHRRAVRGQPAQVRPAAGGIPAGPQRRPPRAGERHGHHERRARVHRPRRGDLGHGDGPRLSGPAKHVRRPSPRLEGKHPIQCHPVPNRQETCREEAADRRRTRGRDHAGGCAGLPTAPRQRHAEDERRGKLQVPQHRHLRALREREGAGRADRPALPGGCGQGGAGGGRPRSSRWPRS